MSGGGHVFNMIASIRNNRNKLGSHKNKKNISKRTRDQNLEKKDFVQPTFTPEQMVEFRNQLKKQKRKENLPIFIIATGSIAAIIYALISSLL